MSAAPTIRETPKAAQAFAVYCALGPEGSLETTRQKLGKNSGYLRVLETWSARYGWVERRNAFWAKRLTEQLEERATKVERARQKFVDALPQATELLVDVALGRVPELKDGQLAAAKMILERSGLTVIKQVNVVHSGDVAVTPRDRLAERLKALRG